MPRQPRPDVPPTLALWISSFTLSLQADQRSDRTRQMYADAVGWFAGALPARVDDWSKVTYLHLRQFFADLTAAGYAQSYVNNIGRCLQAYFKWYSAEEDAPNPFGAKLKVPPPPKAGTNPPPVLAVEQLAALLRDAETPRKPKAKADKRTPARPYEDIRDAAILRLFACTGCRLAELACLKVTDVNTAAREMTVTGKAGKVRTVRFDAKAAKALDRYIRARAKRKAAALPDLWLGIRRDVGMTPDGVYQVVQRRGRRLGLALHPHLFRHTFAHNWLDAGGAEGDLMELAGWDSPQMLRHYGASARGARARRAYDRVDVMGGV